MKKKARSGYLGMSGLSLQQRLPLAIFVLLLSIVVIFTCVAYFGVRKAAIHTGEDRLESLTDQLSSMFGQSTQTMIAAAKTAGSSEPVKKLVKSSLEGDKGAVNDILQKWVQERTTVYASLLDSSGKMLLNQYKDNLHNYKFDSLTIISNSLADTNKVGKLMVIEDSIYFSLITPVMDTGRVIGYLSRWRIQKATEKSIEQFRQLLGEDASLFIGNADGGAWTDLLHPVQKSLADSLTRKKIVFTYHDEMGEEVLAGIQPIPMTSWVVLVQFSKQKLLEPANSFLRLLIIAGSLLILAGLLIAWLIGRTITRPLNNLTAATSALAKGDYSVPVKEDSRGEIGLLASRFNMMASQIHAARLTLEKKVQDRTRQLETVNKELEAFSYSVSHDLRAPLRAINGYSTILKEDYARKMDDEANRLADKIITNAKRMGELIDDLIRFSQMGSKDIVYHNVDMHRLATNCAAELMQNESTAGYKVDIRQLPECRGDESLLKQVWMNLLSNAIKYTSRAKNPVITIGAKEEEDMVTYFVKDNGVGFDMKYADKLFGVFQRLHSTTDFEGTGIGLAFVKRIIVKHEGEIRAEGQLEAGATFYFSLPKAE